MQPLSDLLPAQVGLLGLWLPILLSAVAVFALSSIIHMWLPLHKSDFKKLPDEDKALESLRQVKAAPGEYTFPHPPSMKEMGSPAMLAKYRQGPVGWLVLYPNRPINMGKCLLQWMVLCLVTSVFTAYGASIALTTAASSMDVFRLSFILAILGYGLSSVQDSIWKGVPWCTTAKYILDGTVYAAATAGLFAWLWP